MSFFEYGLLFIVTTLSTASFNFHRLGWLDKVVEYHKNKLFEDFRKVSNVEIKATIQPAPEGYVDSPAWDFDSVTRLLILIRESKTAVPVRRALRRMLGNTRRKMSVRDSYKYFPSLSKDIPNDLYYESDSGEMSDDMVTEPDFTVDEDKDVIIVSNPVEARLPSAMISIDLLRQILEERAKAARYLPTTRKTIPWIPMNKTTLPATLSKNDTNEMGGTNSTGKPGNQTDSSGNSTTNIVATTVAA